MAAKTWYNAVRAGFRRLRDDIKEGRGAAGGDKIESLESLMSFGMGSSPTGVTVSHLMCGNTTNTTKACLSPGLIACDKCHLVKYCSEKCRTHHRSKHRTRCAHPYLSETWEPSWVIERRDPTFLHASNSLTLYRPTVDFGGDLPGMDCLQLSTNEGSDYLNPLGDLKLCFAASGDLRNLIRTINSLPADYTGYCDVLLNETDPVLVNRNLVILFVLLSSGPSLEEAAELATHLMCSAALPGGGAEYVKRCITFIYKSAGECDADLLSFQRCLDTRGEGKVYSVQPLTGIKRLLEMSYSTYTLSSALRSMKDTTLAPDRLDSNEKYFASLKPAHRMSFQRFRETGILAPFSMNTVGFTQPNRFLFSPQGTWIVPEDANPLFGWDVSRVQKSGIKHGTTPEDIMGCLFFHVKDELREFAKRVRNGRIDIHVTSFDAGILAKGITIGALPAFEGASFDRIVTSHLADSAGLRTCLADWGPLLNRDNEFASVIMQMKTRDRPRRTSQCGPYTIELLMEKCNQILGLEMKIKSIFAQGLRSPALFRIFDSLDAFSDNEDVFQEHLRDQDVNDSAAALGLRLRATNRIHSKRLGIPLHAAGWQKLPDLSSNEFYDLFTIGGANLPVRFLEFEAIGSMSNWVDEF